MKFNPLAHAAHLDAVAHGYDSAAAARNDMRRLALRDARDLLRLCELATLHTDRALADEIANFLPQIATLV